MRTNNNPKPYSILCVTIMCNEDVGKNLREVNMALINGRNYQNYQHAKPIYIPTNNPKEPIYAMNAKMHTHQLLVITLVALLALA